MSHRQPNVILITTDQQRFDSVASNGSGFMRTPNVDRLGTEGARFTRAYCPNTVCTPSRASIMTGLHLSRHGAYNVGTTAVDHSSFLSNVLRQAGYRTHHIGKGHWYPWGAPNPETAEVDPDGTPFRDLVGFETAEVALGHAGLWGASGHYLRWLQRKGVDPQQFPLRKLFEKDANGTADWELPTALHSGSWIAERAIDFLRGHDRSQPFYLNLGFPDPHHPHILPADFTNRVDPDAIPLPQWDRDATDKYAEQVPHFHDGTLCDSRFCGKFVIAGNGRTAWKPYFTDETKARGTRAYYYSMVQLIDEQLGTILDAMDELGLAQETIVIFTSDHGEMLGDHCIGQKGPLVYEGVTHIPMFIRYPNGFAPKVVDECVSLVDLAPTVLAFAGIEDGVRRDGVSLAPRLRDEEPLSRPGVRIEFKEEPDRIRYKCWVTPDWKLAVYPGETFGELYDLRRDPGETTNLFAEPEAQPVKLRLMNELLADMERSEPLSARPCRV